MALEDVLRSSFRRSLSLYDELLAQLPEPALGMKLPKLPSDPIAGQLWCVVGALGSSAQAILELLADLESYDDARARFVVDLLEHEAAHQGQLIRYLYGLHLPIPAGWKARYALD